MLVAAEPRPTLGAKRVGAGSAILATGVAFGIVTVALPVRPAHAAWATYGTFAASGGYTDNALFVSQPLPGDPDAPRPEADSFAELRPEVVAITQEARTRFMAQYAFTTEVYQGHEGANSYTNEVSLTFLHLLDAQSDIQLSVTGIQGERSISAITPAGGPVVGAIPQGRVRTLEIRPGEGYTYRFQSPWEFHQNLLGSYVRPLGDYQGPTFYSFDNTFELLRDYNTTHWGASLNTVYAVSGESVVATQMIPATRFLFNRGLIRHRRDLTESLGLELGAGAMQVADGDDPSVAIYEPSGLLILEYTVANTGSVFGAQYDHSAGASTYTGQVVLTDTSRAFMRMDLLPEHELHMEVDANYTFARTFDLIDQIVADRTDILSGAGRLTWNVEDNLAFSLVVQAQRQIPREEPSPASNARDLRRNSVMLTVTGTVGASARRRSTQDASRQTRASDARDIIDGSEEEGGDGRR